MFARKSPPQHVLNGNREPETDTMLTDNAYCPRPQEDQVSIQYKVNQEWIPACIYRIQDEK